MLWWEKTVEYCFVKNYIRDDSIFSPLGGNAEKFFGDLFNVDFDGKARLIEFKREESNISEEVLKYYEKDNVPDGKKYEDAWRDIFLDEIPVGAKGHWIIYGQEESSKLGLFFLQYGESDRSLAKKIETDEDCSYVPQKDLFEYMALLGRGRTRGGKWPSSLVVALVNGNSCVMTPYQFMNATADLPLDFDAPERRIGNNCSI